MREEFLRRESPLGKMQLPEVNVFVVVGCDDAGGRDDEEDEEEEEVKKEEDEVKSEKE